MKYKKDAKADITFASFLNQSWSQEANNSLPWVLALN